ncbi:MAG: hypothetical protein QM635_11265 [Microbacteriaceae bacterium]
MAPQLAEPPAADVPTSFPWFAEPAAAPAASTPSAPARPAPAEPLVQAGEAFAPAASAPGSSAPAGAPDVDGADDFFAPPHARASYTPPANHWSRMGAEHDEEDVFENTLSREVGGGNVTTTSAIILPSLPEPDFSSVINGTGEILVTGTIQLPESLGSLGGDARSLDRSEVDRLLDAFDAEVVSNDSAPVRAIRAVSTHTSTNSVIAQPQKPRGSRLMTVGIVITGALVVAVVGLLAVYVLKM